MTENKRFRNALIEFHKVTQNLEREKKTFEFEAENIEDNKLLQSIYLKLIRNKTEVFEHLKELEE